MVIVEKLVEWRLAGETEVLGENLPPPATLSTTNPTCLDPDLNTGRRGGKPATNRLSFGATFNTYLFNIYLLRTYICGFYAVQFLN
jgi:hypothetical protein